MAWARQGLVCAGPRAATCQWEGQTRGLVAHRPWVRCGWAVASPLSDRSIRTAGRGWFKKAKEEGPELPSREHTSPAT